MAGAPCSISNNNTASPSSSSAVNHIGSLLSVTSNSEIRYEGILYYLNPQDSILGLKDVRLYGTEGRQKDGQQVPPSDIVYEYILFRSSDIKDFDVKGGPPVQEEKPIYIDPAVIQSKFYSKPSSSSKSVPATSRPLTETEFNLHQEPFASNAIFYPSLLPSHHSETPLGMWDSSQSTHSAAPSCGVPRNLRGYSEGPGSTGGTQQHSLSSNAILHPLQNQTSTTLALANLPNDASIHLNATPSLTSKQTSASFTGSPFRKPSLPFHHFTLVRSDGLAMPSSLSYEDASSFGAQDVDEVFPGPLSSPAVQFPPYSPSSCFDPISNPCLRQKQALLTPNPSQPKLSERSPMSRGSSSSPAFQSPNLLPLPSEKLQCQYPSHFTKDFDFQAMNEKFKKDEVWGYLGKANQRQKAEGQHEIRTSSQDMAFKSDSKLSYSKNDFFDRISCFSPGDVPLRFAERMRMDAETFGDFQWKMLSGYGQPTDDEVGPYNRGRGPHAQR